MRGVIQRVTRASVEIGGETVGKIDAGILLLLGIAAADCKTDADYILDKTLNLRVFEDNDHKMNRSLTESGLGLLVVSQFTLYADARRGRRPSLDSAASPSAAKILYEYLLANARKRSDKVESGRFGATMEVSLINSGPVTILLDSSKAF